MLHTKYTELTKTARRGSANWNRRRGGAIRSGDFKLVERFETGRVSLYNLKDDPFESTNVADQHPEKLRALMKGLVMDLIAQSALYPVDEQGNAIKPAIP